MSSVVLSGDTSGIVSLTVPAVAGTNTVTFPAATGTVMVSGNMPAFSAYANASQTVTNNVFTKVALQVKEFDTANCFDNTTNYRFTPNVAGYYQVNAQLVLVGTVATTQAIVSVYKNGSANSWGINVNPSASLASNGSTNISYSTLVYLNGSTDYIELYGYYYGTTGTCTFSTSAPSYYTSRFSASLVRTS